MGFAGIVDIASASTRSVSDAVRRLDPSALRSAFDSIDANAIKNVIKKMDTDALTSIVKNLDTDAISRVMKNVDDANFNRIASKLDNAQVDALKRLDDFPANKLDDVIDAGTGVGTKIVQGSTKFCKKNPIICASPFAYAGLRYVDQRKQDELDRERENSIRECISVCLPSGWDEHQETGEDIAEENYKTREDFEYLLGDDVHPDDAINWDEQPLCSKDDGDCGEFCTKKCEELNPPRTTECTLTNPGACLPKNPFDPNEWLNKLKEALNKLFGGLFNVDYLIYASCFCCCMLLIFMFVS